MFAKGRAEGSVCVCVCVCVCVRGGIVRTNSVKKKKSVYSIPPGCLPTTEHEYTTKSPK